MEHHQSSDNRLPERGLTDADLRTIYADLLPHELVHAWNGKYRRPADMVRDDYQQPQRTRLLWVYEGLTHYLGMVLAARCGLLDEGQFRDLLAITAEGQRNQRGRSWRPLSDTAVAAQLLFHARPDRATWRRSVDFYAEGVLLWLEVDTILRERTRGERSLDDFCRRFHGGQDESPAVRTYDLDDVVAALDETAPFEWKSFLSGRVEEVSEQAPLEGVRKGGWRLTYADQPSGVQRGMEGVTKTVDLMPSVGVSLGQDGAVIDVVPEGAADRAGVGPGMKLIAVNSRRYSPQVLRAAVGCFEVLEGPPGPPRGERRVLPDLSPRLSRRGEVPAPGAGPVAGRPAHGDPQALDAERGQDRSGCEVTSLTGGEATPATADARADPVQDVGRRTQGSYEVVLLPEGGFNDCLPTQR